MQTQVMQRAIDEILLTTHQQEKMFVYTASSNNLLAYDYDKLTRKLSMLQSVKDKKYGDVIQEVTLLDDQGYEIISISRTETYSLDKMASRADSDEYLQPKVTRKIYYGPVLIDPVTLEPRIILAVPIIDPCEDVFSGILLGKLRLQQVWDIIVNRPIGEKGILYITDWKGKIIAHPDPSVVFRTTVVDPLAKPGLHTGINGELVVQTSGSFNLGERELNIVSEVPFSEVLDLSKQTINISIFLLLVFLVLAFSVGLAIIDRIASPIESLAVTAEAVSEGNYDCRADEQGYLEINTLTRAFNLMTSLLVNKILELRKIEYELQASRDAMEHKVEVRTAELVGMNEELEEEILIRRKTEESLSRYSKIVNSSNDLMAMVGGGYKFLAINDAYLKDFDMYRWQILDKTVQDLYGESVFYGFLKEKLDKTFDGQEVQYEGWLEVGTVGRRYVEMILTPYRDEFDSITGVVINARDATGRVILENNLRQAEKMQAIGTLASGIAHDFNNVLHSIFGCARIAQKDVKADSVAYKWLEKLIQIGQRSADMIRQIKMFSQQAQVSKKPVDLGVLIDEVVRLQSVSLPDNVTILKNIAKCGDVLADMSQLYQVIGNLIINAKYAVSEKGSVITVGLAEVNLDGENAARHKLKFGSYAKVTVEDNGYGIDEETRKRIFEPFFTTKSFGKGTGLGLSICHGIVTGLKGAIDVHSISGQGSIFTIYLPIIMEDEKASLTVAEKEGEATVPGLHTGSLLYVDDEKINVEVWEAALQEEGFKVQSALSGLEALRLLKSAPQSFDVVLTDHKMPGMSGTELAHEINILYPELPIILITGWYKEGDIGEGEVQAEFAKIMKKPIEMDELIAAISLVRNKK
ncbi:MAG: response regulator [Desulfobulbaceae bacterium]|nr:response regulator [Desulfobulbaceae bacterium]